MIVDSQVHLWKAETPERVWPSWGQAVSHLPEPLGYESMLRLMDEAGVDRAIVVPPSWEGDRNDYALEAARRHPDRFAAVGRIALDDPGSAALLPRWKDQGLLGVRLTFSYGKESWLTDGTTDWFWPLVEAEDIPVMMLVPNNTREVAQIAAAHPRLRIIIDHFGLSRKLAREGKALEAMERTAALARFPNVYVKTSSSATYSREAWPFSDLYPGIRRIIEAFGPARCFWGADLSICFHKCPYREHVTHFTQALDFLSENDKRLIMGQALLDFLGWPD